MPLSDGPCLTWRPNFVTLRRMETHYSGSKAERLKGAFLQ